MPQTVTGKVAAIETSSSSESVSKVTYTVTVSIDNSQKMLSSGAATQVIILIRIMKKMNKKGKIKMADKEKKQAAVKSKSGIRKR